MPWLPNPGKLPDDCVTEDDHGNIRHRAVHVRLGNGWDSEKAGTGAWPSKGGNPPTRWTLSEPPHPFDIVAYEVI